MSESQWDKYYTPSIREREAMELPLWYEYYRQQAYALMSDAEYVEARESRERLHEEHKDACEMHKNMPCKESKRAMLRTRDAYLYQHFDGILSRVPGR